MVEYGVTNTGFVKKTYAEVINSLHTNAIKAFGSNVDLSPGSPIKLLIDVYGFQIINLWDQLEACYNASFLETASGISLDNLGKLVGAERGSATYATGYITFFRNEVMPDGSPRIIPSGTKVTTADILANEYITTQSVYFEPTITDEQHTITEETFTVDVTNIIGSIISVTDSNDASYIVGETVTFDGRTLTFLTAFEVGMVITITYKPLSITAPIIAITPGASSNVAANVITILSTKIDFIHYIENENGIDTGSDVESDSHFRKTIVGATQGVGRATSNSIKYYLSQVTGVKTVVIEDPLRTSIIESVSGNGETSISVTHLPIQTITSVIGSVGGTYTVDSFNTVTGEIQLSTATNASETISVSYSYFTPGKIKIYVEGGETGDEFTPDTIVYTIENTRACGIQSVGYDSGDPGANGSNTAKFSWFYRPNNAYIDVNITIYFDSDSKLLESDRTNILNSIQDKISDYIDDLALGEKVYKNKILQIAISENVDILDAELTGWEINNESVDIANSYIQIGSMEVAIANYIVLSHTTA